MTSLFRGRVGVEYGLEGSIGAFDPLKDEREGVPGRGVDVGLASREDAMVDIRRSHVGLDVPGPETLDEIGSCIWPDS